MALTIDESGNRWLVCDMCRPSQAERFNGIGLETTAAVRYAARDLDGWERRKIIVCMEPWETVMVDLCRVCKQPEILSFRLIFIAGRSAEAVHP